MNMNVLAKTKKHFLRPIKDENGVVKRHPSFQVFLNYWNTLLASTEEQAYDDLLEEMRLKYPAATMSYCKSTWLHLWKEKLVAY